MGQPRHRGTDCAAEPVLPHISANDSPRTGPFGATRWARGAHLLAMLLAAVLLVSCTPTEPVPSPTPSVAQPTVQCTPESGEGDPTPCTSAEYDEMKERDALYAEAERILRRVDELSYGLRAQRLPITNELAAMLSGESLASITEVLATGQTSDSEWSGLPDIVWVRRAPNISDLGSVVALESCTTAGTLRITRNNEQEESQPPFIQQSFYIRIDDSLRLNSSLFYETESC